MSRSSPPVHWHLPRRANSGGPVQSLLSRPRGPRPAAVEELWLPCALEHMLHTSRAAPRRPRPAVSPAVREGRAATSREALQPEPQSEVGGVFLEVPNVLILSWHQEQGCTEGKGRRTELAPLQGEVRPLGEAQPLAARARASEGSPWRTDPCSSHVQLKEMCRRELDKAESEIKKNSSIIGDYKQVGPAPRNRALFPASPACLDEMCPPAPKCLPPCRQR